MANVCLDDLIVTGPEGEVASFIAAARGPDKFSALDPAEEGETLLSFPALYPVPEGVPLLLWMRQHWGCEKGAFGVEVIRRDLGSVHFRFDTRWTPPVEFLEYVSANYPGLTFDLRYTIFGISDAGTYRIGAGRAELVEHWNGYFHHRPDLVAPIHHRVIRFSVQPDPGPEAVRAALDQRGLIILGEEPDGYFTSRHSADTITAFLRERFPGCSVEVAEMAYTLDEKLHLESLHTSLHLQESDTHGIIPIPGWLRPLSAVAERGILLTDEERDWVIRGLIAKRDEYGRIERLERLRLLVGQDVFQKRYRDLILQRVAQAEQYNRSQKGQPVTHEQIHHIGIRKNLRGTYFRADDVTKLFRWFQEPLPEAQSAEWGYCCYAPTREELEFVLEGHRQHFRPWTEGRIAEIEAAIRSPRWTTEWPAWDRRRAQTHAPGIAPEESKTDLLEDPEFLAEIMKV